VTSAVEEALALAARLPGATVATLFARYGKPLAEPLPPAEDDALRIEVSAADGAIAIVRAINVRTMVDVIGNDWFVLEAPGAEPLAMPGPLFASAVAALTRKLSTDSGSRSR
jgi:hypothetical protein